MRLFSKNTKLIAEPSAESGSATIRKLAVGVAAGAAAVAGAWTVAELTDKSVGQPARQAIPGDGSKPYIHVRGDYLSERAEAIDAFVSARTLDFEALVQLNLKKDWIDFIGGESKPGVAVDALDFSQGGKELLALGITALQSEQGQALRRKMLITDQAAAADNIFSILQQISEGSAPSAITPTQGVLLVYLADKKTDSNSPEMNMPLFTRLLNQFERQHILGTLVD